LEAGAGSVEAANLRENVLPVVVWHFHALIVISQRGIRHFEGLHGHGADTAEVGLIALVLEDCFLSQFDSVLLLHFSNHIFQELQLILLFNDLGVHLDLNLLLQALFVDFVTRHLRENLQTFHDSSSQSLLVEIVTVSFQALEPAIFLSLLLEKPEQDLLSPLLCPLVNELIDDVLVSVVLRE
jgi:hypothetical protein